MPRTNDIPRGTHTDPLWYQQAVIYQVHVRAFKDSVADGVGDFPGLTEKLDYIQELGVTAIWLLPFYPSPLKDDGYDIADYCAINPIYGTLADFKEFLREAHRRGLRVITELVLNHTSDQHEWFQKSRRDPPGGPWREFYVWSDTPEKYKDARVIFKDFEPSNWAWDPLAKAYYWHRFYAHQPDLNFDNPHVHKAIFKALDFWLDLGVDGFRLDAVPYLYEREGTNCEGLPETHAFLKKLRAHLDETYGDRMLLAEANAWPETAVTYFGADRGDECQMAFHFPLMPRLFMSVRMEDRTPIVDILEQTPPIPETAQWAIFLRNHDELTLEMVTDEERDYMYRVYAQDQRARINLGIRRRLAPLLGNDRKRIELLNALLLSLPGTPVIYYGDEIGMGDNIFLGDRHGVRTPMHWSADKNAGFSRANPQRLYSPIILDPEYHYEAVNVETQERNPHSLLWWTRRLLALRRRVKAFGCGTIEFLRPENRKILAFVRRLEGECVLVVCNLSRFVQPVALDLSAYAPLVPVEMLGSAALPPITGKPYFLTLGPHGFYWFNLLPKFTETAVPSNPDAELPVLSLSGRWETLFGEPTINAVEQSLLAFVNRRNLRRGATREAKAVKVADRMPLPVPGGRMLLVLLRVDLFNGDSEYQWVPLGFKTGADADALLRDRPHLAVARATRTAQGTSGVLYSDAEDQAFVRALVVSMSRRRNHKTEHGKLRAWGSADLWQQRRELAELEPVPCPPGLRHSDTVIGKRLFLKLYRRVEPGSHPEIELNRFLTELSFDGAPALLGTLEYDSAEGETWALGVLHSWLPQARTAWEFTLDTLGRYFDRIESLPREQSEPPQPAGDTLECAAVEPPLIVQERLGTYVEAARLLGESTARLHLALASAPEHPEFAPEPFTPNYQRSLFQSYRNVLKTALGLLRQQAEDLPEALRPLAREALAREAHALQICRAVVDTHLSGRRIRVHGDYCLTQLLHSGRAFVIIDFEGEPERPLSERRIKRTPLRDVASLLSSFRYAAHAACQRHQESRWSGGAGPARLGAWTGFWSHWAGAVFLRSYLHTIGPSPLLPQTMTELRVLLNADWLNRIMVELMHEANHRRGQMAVPLQELLEVLPAASNPTHCSPG